MLRYMSQSKNIGLLPGGFEEATIYARGKHRVYIKHRAGFIKYALQYGYRIYPAYTFGEELAYHSFTPLLKYRLLLNKLKLPGVVFLGKYGLGFVPDWDIDLISVVGQPIELPEIKHPSADEIDHYHQLYIQRLKELFDRYKREYAAQGEQAELEIW
jgi:hypothetical protein